jgi:hypothetical protein
MSISSPELKTPARRSRRERLDPAKSVVEKFARHDPEKNRTIPGEYVLAEEMGCNPSVILRWMYSVDKADGGRTPGTGGRIPFNRHEDLLAIAARLGIKLDQSELYPRLADAS